MLSAQPLTGSSGRICLRRAAFRVLSSTPSKPTSLSLRSQSRSITSLTSSSLRTSFSKSSIVPTQRRWASEEITQAEPEADGATEAQHGDNSIAKSASGQAEEAVENATESTNERVTEAAPETVTETTSSVGESVSNAARNAADSVKSTAESLGAAAGFGSRAENDRDNARLMGSRPPDGETSATVYVGNLFFDVRGEDLKKEFERAGTVVSTKIIMDQRGLSKGFGYVEFETVEAATKAIDLYNLQNFEGRRLSVQYSVTRNTPDRVSSRNLAGQNGERPLHAPTNTLFIGNMSFDMSDRDLNNLFREIKNVIDVRVAIDRRTGQPRGFAHADFVKVEDAQRAMEALKGKVVCGRALRVDYSTSTGRAATAGGMSGSERDTPAQY